MKQLSGWLHKVERHIELSEGLPKQAVHGAVQEGCIITACKMATQQAVTRAAETAVKSAAYTRKGLRRKAAGWLHKSLSLVLQ